MSDTKNNDYDKSDVYENEIAPRVKDLMLICLEHRMPMFFTVADKNDAHSTSYRTSVLHAPTNIHLTDNRIAQALLFLNGFHNDIPQNIRSALREIAEYAYAVKHVEFSTQIDGMDEKLTDDIFDSLFAIVNGGDKVKIEDGK